MAAIPFGTTFRRLLHRIDPQATGDWTDGALLARFAANRDEAAFIALVARHGPMVLGLCRRVLGDAHDAEDAFQATFLVLARKASSLDGNQPLGSWLYTVARNLALKLRGRDARRRIHEREAGVMPKNTPPDEIAWRELRGVLDDELGRLPDKYRAPLVLCYLQGMTHEAAAKELGWPAGSMAKRLTRGQELLRERLAGRGVTLSIAALLILVAKRGTAAVSPAVAQGIGKAAVQFVAGKPTGTLVSTAALTLAGAALRAFAFSKLKIAAGLFLLVGLVGGGVGIGYFAQQTGTPAAEPGKPAGARQPGVVAKADDEKDDQLRRRLEMPVNLDKGIDSNTPLKDALEFLSQRHEFQIAVDERTFAAHGVPQVIEQPVGLPKMVGVRLRVVLSLLLGQIATDDGMLGGYRIKNGVVAITPVEPSEPGEGWVSTRKVRRMLRPVSWDRDMPVDVPFMKVLEQIGEQYGEKFTIDDKAFVVLGGVSPRNSVLAPWKLKGQSEPLVSVLDFCMELFQGKEFLATYRIKPDGIEITAVKHYSPEAKALTRALEPIRHMRESERRTAEYTRKLENINVDEVTIDANTSFRDAVEYLSDKFGMTMIVDSKTFEAVGFTKPDEEPVGLPKQKNRKLSAIVQMVLEQMQKDDWIAGYIVHEDYIAIVPQHKNLKQKKPLTKEQLAAFWHDLSGGEWRRPVIAAQILAEFPEQTVEFLRERVRPASRSDPKKVAEAARWVKDLDSDEFAVRQKATDELERLGKDAIDALREGLRAKPSLEARHRLEQLLEQVDLPFTQVELRDVRAIHILEIIGTPEAERLLESLAKGLQVAVSTEKAKAALERMNK